jgi:hypothetical protein
MHLQLIYVPSRLPVITAAPATNSNFVSTHVAYILKESGVIHLIATGIVLEDLPTTFDVTASAIKGAIDVEVRGTE